MVSLTVKFSYMSGGAALFTESDPIRCADFLVHLTRRARAAVPQRLRTVYDFSDTRANIGIRNRRVDLQGEQGWVNPAAA
jgi:hypothetical protein